MASMLPKPDVGRALALLSWQQEGDSVLHGPGTLRWLPDHWRDHEQKDENPLGVWGRDKQQFCTSRSLLVSVIQKFDRCTSLRWVVTRRRGDLQVTTSLSRLHIDGRIGHGSDGADDAGEVEGQERAAASRGVATTATVGASASLTLNAASGHARNYTAELRSTPDIRSSR